jgi:hypothetical protein
MQQRFRRLALFVGASTLAMGGFILVACGTDNGSTSTPVPGVDSGGKDSAKGDTSTTTDPDGGTGSDSPSGVDCGSSPQLRTNTEADGFFCAFYKPEAGASANCAKGQTCCNPGIADGGTFAGKFPPAFCANGTGGDAVCAAQDTANGSDYQPGFFSNAWACNDKTACAAGEICVMFTSDFVTNPGTDKANVGVDTKAPAACHEYKAYKMGGSKCKTGAPVPGEVQLCSLSDPGNCGAGTSCQPFNGNGRDLGSCR